MARRQAQGRGQWRRLAVAGPVFVVAYLLAAEWAVRFSIEGSVLIWFPPAGVAVAAFVLAGRRLFVFAVAAEVISTTFVTDFADEFGPVWLAINSVLIPLGYLVGAEILTALDLDPALPRVRDVVVFLAGGAVGASLVATIGGIGAQVGAGLVEMSEVPRSAGIFFVGDAVGIIGVTPIVLAAGLAWQAGAVPALSIRHRQGPLTLIEIAVPSVAAVALLSIGEEPQQFLYLVFVPVTLVAVRHGMAATVLSTALLTGVVTGAADTMTTATLDRSDLQALLGIVVLTGLLLAAVAGERMRALHHHRRLSEIVTETPDLVGTAAADGTITYLNPVGRSLLGLVPGQGDSPPTVRDFVDGELPVALLREAIAIADRDGVWRGNTVIRAADGRGIPVSQTLVAHRDGDTGRVYSTVLRDITDQRRLEEQLERAAVRDEMTGLANRTMLVAQLTTMLGRVDHPGAVTVLCIDIDRFRLVNETYGHDVGDGVVTEIAARLAGAAGSADLVARTSGAMFAIVLGAVTDEFETISLGEQILGAIRAPLQVQGRSLVLSGSCGGVMVPTGADAHDTLRKAEIAMHRAKEAGGNRLTLFDENMDRRARDRLQLESDLRDVIDNGDWWLAYQPIVATADRRVVSCEALLRWDHPTRGPVSPAEVIPLAESTGLILSLGRDVLDRACRQLTRWHAGGRDLSVSVNVSRHQLRSTSFVTQVGEVLEHTGADPGAVVLEVTETALAGDPDTMVPRLVALRELGCRIAMDDFGTGYSSLGSLRDLPIDVLKLDRTFMTGLTGSDRAAAAVDAVVRLADRLGLDVVAEGVEERTQFDLLHSMGCPSVQGYLIARPMPVLDFETFLVGSASK